MAKRAAPTIAALQRLFDRSSIGSDVRHGQVVRSEGSEGSDSVLKLDQILLETDAPFMAPDKSWLRKETGLGGRKNEPAAMPAVCRAAAAALGVDEPILAKASTTNAVRFFGLEHKREMVYGPTGSQSLEMATTSDVRHMTTKDK